MSKTRQDESGIKASSNHTTVDGISSATAKYSCARIIEVNQSFTRLLKCAAQAKPLNFLTRVELLKLGAERFGAEAKWEGGHLHYFFQALVNVWVMVNNIPENFRLLH